MMTDTARILRQLNEGFEHTLPSGLVVKMKRLSLEAYKRAGTLPTHLQAIVQGIRDKGFPLMYQENEPGVSDFFEWVICEALVDPKVAVEPQDEETMPLDYLPEQDKSDIFQVAFLNVAKAIERLRPLSKAKAARGSASLTPSGSVTESDRAD